MSYHYGANYGLVIRFDEDTAEKMGVLKEFKFVQADEEGLIFLEECYGNRSTDFQYENTPLMQAITKIVEAIDNTFGKRVDLLRVGGEMIEPGDVITDDDMLFFFFGHEDFYDCTPNNLFLLLKEMGLEPTPDAWVTGG